jgi:hypothetical protein
MRTVTLSSRHHAAHILHVLSTAKDALLTFSTAFRLAVMLSREHASSTGSALQQQQQQQGASHSHTQQEYASWGAAGEQQQQLGGRGMEAYAELHSAAHSLAGQTDRTAGATISEAGVKLPSAHEPPQKCINTGDAGEVTGADTLAGGNTQQQPQQHPCAPAQAISSPATEPAAPAAAVAAGMHSPELAAVGETTAPTAAAAAAGIAPDGQLDAFDNIEDAAEWQHSEEGWQELLQRAWHGDADAVLACAQELIHGGDYCLQDFSLAVQLLHTVSNGVGVGGRVGQSL